MKKNKTLHICPLDKFIPPFIDFVNVNVNSDDQFFLTCGDIKKHTYKRMNNIKHLKGQFLKYFYFLVKMNLSNKIILHGLFDKRFIVFIAFQPWLLKKCYWVMWGGDLYDYKFGVRNYKWHVYELFRKFVFKRIGYLVTGTSGDVELARNWYQAQGKHIRCFNYPSNIYKELPICKKEKTKLSIQVGNSSDPTNRHEYIFKLIKKHDGTVFCPLAYGDVKYANEINSMGNLLFPNRFNTIRELIPLDKYIEILSEIDIAIFAHKRQQAFGNIITLLGLGKTVYISPESTLFELFEEFDIKVHSIDDDEIKVQNECVTQKNIKLVKERFSKKSLVDSLKSWII